MGAIVELARRPHPQATASARRTSRRGGTFRARRLVGLKREVWEPIPGKAANSPAPTAPKSAWRRVSAGPRPVGVHRSCARKRGAIPMKRVPTSRGAVYPSREARGVLEVAADAVAPERLPCDTRTMCEPLGIGSAGHEVGRRTEERDGQRWGRQSVGATETCSADRVLHLLRVSFPSRRSGGESAARLRRATAGGDDRAPGETGSFGVFLNRRKVFSKHALDRFPEVNEVEAKIGELVRA